jgi:hypothetical protein
LLLIKCNITSPAHAINRWLTLRKPNAKPAETQQNDTSVVTGRGHHEISREPIGTLSGTMDGDRVC